METNLQKINHFLISNFYKVFNPLRKHLYWRIFKPKTQGVKCVVSNGARVLLVKLSYSHRGYTFPGGRLYRNESFRDAAIRETKEESGINLKDVKEIGNYYTEKEYKRDTVVCFGAEVGDDFFKVDGLEITDAGWFSRDSLPENRAPKVELIFDMFINNYEN